MASIRSYDTIFMPSTYCTLARRQSAARPCSFGLHPGVGSFIWLVKPHGEVMRGPHHSLIRAIAQLLQGARPALNLVFSLVQLPGGQGGRAQGRAAVSGGVQGRHLQAGPGHGRGGWHGCGCCAMVCHAPEKAAIMRINLCIHHAALGSLLSNLHFPVLHSAATSCLPWCYPYGRH